MVKSETQLPSQYHNNRAEVYTIISRKAQVTISAIEKIYNASEVIFIPLKVKHRVKNRGSKQFVFIEVQTGNYFGEEDRRRIKDDFNRS